MEYDFLGESHIVMATTDYVADVIPRDVMIAQLLSEREAEFKNGK